MRKLTELLATDVPSTIGQEFARAVIAQKGRKFYEGILEEEIPFHGALISYIDWVEDENGVKYWDDLHKLCKKFNL